MSFLSSLFKPKRDLPAERHHELLLASLKLERQLEAAGLKVGALSERIDKLDLKLEEKIGAARNTLEKSLADGFSAQHQAMLEIAKSAHETITEQVRSSSRLLAEALGQAVAANLDAIAKIAPAVIADAKQRQIDYLKVMSEGRNQVAELFPVLDTLAKGIAGEAARTREEVARVAPIVKEHLFQSLKPCLDALKENHEQTAGVIKGLETLADGLELVADAQKTLDAKHAQVLPALKAHQEQLAQAAQLSETRAKVLLEATKENAQATAGVGRVVCELVAETGKALAAETGKALNLESSKTGKQLDAVNTKLGALEASLGNLSAKISGSVMPRRQEPSASVAVSAQRKPYSLHFNATGSLVKLAPADGSKAPVAAAGGQCKIVHLNDQELQECKKGLLDA